MKLIYTDKRTSQHSHKFEKSSCQIISGFFFNYRGSTIQKTLEGLMRNVLRQVLVQLSKSALTQKYLDFLLEATPFKSRDNAPPELGLRPDLVKYQEEGSWPLDRLEEALRVILSQNQVDLRITFFFDALDEFDGPPDYICRFLRYITTKPDNSLTYVKVCFSSRPWEDFVKNFSTGPKLSVEHFTTADIRLFCSMELVKAVKNGMHDVVPQLANRIVDRASGVFLWASLISKELAAQFEGGRNPPFDSLLELLNSVPDELSEYYHYIIQRIPSSIRWQTYALLEATVRARTPEEYGLLYIWKTTRISHCPTYDACGEVLGSLKTHDDRATMEKAHRNVLRWGGGLVSILPASQFSESVTPTIQVMHQTVYEFVINLDFKDQVLGPIAKVTYENGHSFHLKSILQLDRGMSRIYGSGHRHPKIPLSMDHGSEAEQTTGRSCKVFLDSVPIAVIKRLGVGLMSSSIKAPDGFLCNLFSYNLIQTHAALAIYFRLQLYLRDCVNQSPDYFTTLTPPNKLLSIIAVMVFLGLPDPDPDQRLLAAEFILEHGYGVAMEPTVFPCLLSSDLREIAAQGNIWQRVVVAIDSLATLLLKHGQPLDETVDTLGDGTGKPIHLALPKTLTWLLDNEPGISVNALDSLGRTPLDVVLTKHRPSFVSASRENICLLYQLVIILTARGGQGSALWGDFWPGLLHQFRSQNLNMTLLPVTFPCIPRTNNREALKAAGPKRKNRFSGFVGRLLHKGRPKIQVETSTGPKLPTSS